MKKDVKQSKQVFSRFRFDVYHLVFCILSSPAGASRLETSQTSGLVDLVIVTPELLMNERAQNRIPFHDYRVLGIPS